MAKVVMPIRSNGGVTRQANGSVALVTPGEDDCCCPQCATVPCVNCLGGTMPVQYTLTTSGIVLNSCNGDCIITKDNTGTGLDSSYVRHAFSSPPNVNDTHILTGGNCAKLNTGSTPLFTATATESFSASCSPTSFTRTGNGITWDLRKYFNRWELIGYSGGFPLTMNYGMVFFFGRITAGSVSCYTDLEFTNMLPSTCGPVEFTGPATTSMMPLAHDGIAVVTPCRYTP